MIIKAILFDLDGVLVESEKAHFKALEELLAQYGKPTPKEWFLPMIGMDNDESANFILKETGLSMTVQEMNDFRFENVIRILTTIGKPKQGTLELLNNCQQQNLRLAVASNSPPRYVHAVLDALQIKDKFIEIVTAYDVPEGKPAPDVYLEAARRLKVNPAECIGVEDSLLGLQALIAAKMTSVAVPNPYLSVTDFGDADHVFGSLSEFNDRLPELIGA